MRQLATLPGEEAAQTLVNHLFSLKIETRLLREGEGWAIWVCDEDRLPEARLELEAFERDPGHKRFRRGVRLARAIRRKQAREEERLRRHEERIRRREGRAEAEPRRRVERTPLTFTLIAISVGVFVLSDFGREQYSILQYLFITVFRRTGFGGIEWNTGLVPIRHGELWRLVTPIFIHFSLMHLVFNMIMMYSLGRQLEQVVGTRRLLVLVLALAVLSNLAAYYMAHLGWTEGHFDRQPSPLFGGMSGVLYGLFGYIWMKSHYEPQSRLSMSPMTIFLMLAFFFLCLTGEMGKISNMAHLAGLLAGMFISYYGTRFFGARKRG